MSDNQLHGIDLKGFTFQRMARDLVSNDKAKWDFSDDGSQATADVKGYTIELNGVGLGADGGLFTGTLFDFKLLDDKGYGSFLFVVPATLQEYMDAAKAGTNPTNPANAPLWYDILVPPDHFMFFTGDAKDNILEGSAGDDFGDGGKGNDRVIVGLGNDDVEGGKGTDMADASEITFGIDYNMAKATLNFDIYSSTYTGFEDATGTAFDDRFIGTNRANWLFGEDGNDFFKGQGGDDWLNGGRGRDFFYDGLGSDWLVGGKGGDRFRMYGAEAGDNVIVDLEPGKDKISMKAFGFTSFEDIEERAVVITPGVLINYGDDFGGGSLQINDVFSIETIRNTFTF